MDSLHGVGVGVSLRVGAQTKRYELPIVLRRVEIFGRRVLKYLMLWCFWYFSSSMGGGILRIIAIAFAVNRSVVGAAAALEDDAEDVDE